MKKIFKNNKLLSLLIFLLSGFVLGLIFIFLINKMDKLLIKNEINSYLNLINNLKLNRINISLNIFYNNSITLIIIFIFGFVFFLFPLTYIVVFYKGFTLGFLLANLIKIKSIKGIIIFIILFIPNFIIYLSCIIILSLLSINFSEKIYNLLFKNKIINFKKAFLKYFISLIILLFVLLITAIIEVFISYKLISIIV